MRPNYRFLLPRAGLLAAAFAAASAASGCAQLGVKPWQRDLLSREEMSRGSETLDRRLDEHVYACKGSGGGGRGFIGGDYGCN